MSGSPTLAIREEKGNVYRMSCHEYSSDNSREIESNGSLWTEQLDNPLLRRTLTDLHTRSTLSADEYAVVTARIHDACLVSDGLRLDAPQSSISLLLSLTGLYGPSIRL